MAFIPTPDLFLAERQGMGTILTPSSRLLIYIPPFQVSILLQVGKQERNNLHSLVSQKLTIR